MQHFQPILIVIGLLAIGGVLIHGYLLTRKEKSSATNEPVNIDMFAKKSMPESFETADDTVSEVRVIRAQQEDDIDFSAVLNDDKIEVANFSEPVLGDIDCIEISPFSDPVEIDESTPEKSASFSELSTEELPTVCDVEAETIAAAAPVNNEPVVIAEPELFIFNVVAKEDRCLGGHELLQFFLTSGFRFGEMSIFHRHLYSDGTGPILFSIANMMAPGVFDPENMEQFKSEGVSFFLTAPNKHINIKESFDMMLTAVEQMAEEFDCLVLNAQREQLTQAQFVEYNNRLLHHI